MLIHLPLCEFFLNIPDFEEFLKPKFYLFAESGTKVIKKIIHDNFCLPDHVWLLVIDLATSSHASEDKLLSISAIL